MSRAAMAVVFCVVAAASGLAAERKEGSPEQIRLCVRNLTHELPRMRASAARALGEIGGESAVEPLIERLTDADADVRMSAASALGHINKHPLLCIEQLTKLLHDSDEHVRYSAQWTIGQFAEGFLQSRAMGSANDDPLGQLLASAAGVMAKTGAPESIQERVREASDLLLHKTSRGQVYENGAKAPRTSIPGSIEMVAFVDEFKAEDVYIQVRALARLKDVEPKHVADLIRLLAEIREESAVEWQIPQALAEAGREIVPGLVEVLQGDDETAQQLALDVLIELSSGAEQAWPQLNKILDDDEAGEDRLTKAIIAISNIGAAAKDSSGLLARLAANSILSDTVRAEALNALAAIGPDAESVLPTIKRILRHNGEPAELRIAAAEALIRIPQQPEETLKLLRRLIEEIDDSNLATGIAAALGELGPHAAPTLPVIVSLLEAQDVDGESRQALILALGKIGPAANQAIPALLDLLVDQEQNEPVQVAAALALANIGPEAVSGMADLFQKTESEIRLTIARAMVAIGPRAEPAVRELVQVLSKGDEENKSRILAAIALGKIGPSASAAIPALGKLLVEAANDDQLRAMCAIAIGSIDREAAALLQKAMDDPSPEVRIAVAYTLVKSQRDGSPAELMRLVEMLSDDEAEDLAGRALADIGPEAVVPLCGVIFHPNSDVDLRFRAVEVLGDIGQPAISTLIGLLENAELTEAAGEALQRQDRAIVPTLILAIESERPFSEATREAMRDVVRGFYDGLGAGGDELTWGQAHPLAALSDDRSSGSSGGRKVIRLGPPLAVMGKPRTEVIAKGFQAVKVFYGTNRKPDSAASAPAAGVRPLQVAAITALALCFICLWFHTPKHMLAISMTGIGLVVVAAPLVLSLSEPQSQSEASGIYTYGGEYSDQVEMGICEVSIPDIHEEGELEGPSLMRLEIKVDPERHIVLGHVQPLSHQAFFTGLEGELSQKGRNVLVFIHGYNVSFEDAARRTAQMAADLKFPGAAVFYSWPSQAHWYKYRLDERNVELSVEQLKSFLLAVAERSHADTINLVAHSMGNRLLAEALKEIDSSSRDQGTLFNEVVLAAPDIDAAVFKNRIAPAIVTKAHRITLYASSKDLALYASRQFNSGDPRAGDAGEDVLVIPGIETIDASAGDCSLLGHCYYGDSVSILHDIQQLLTDRPARDRQGLHPISRSGSVYWIFEPDGVALRPDASSAIR